MYPLSCPTHQFTMCHTQYFRCAVVLVVPVAYMRCVFCSSIYHISVLHSIQNIRCAFCPNQCISCDPCFIHTSYNLFHRPYQEHQLWSLPHQVHQTCTLYPTLYIRCALCQTPLIHPVSSKSHQIYEMWPILALVVFVKYTWNITNRIRVIWTLVHIFPQGGQYGQGAHFHF